MFSLFNKLTGRGDAATVEPATPPPSAPESPAVATPPPAPDPAPALNVDALLAPPAAPEAAVAWGPADPEKTETFKPAIVEAISTVFDPEIPVNIYELGLIYEIGVDAQNHARVLMTLTSPACPSAQQLPSEVRFKVKAIEGIADSTVEVVWEPPWTKDMMSEAARLSLGMF